MARYRKKPVVISAVQWDGVNIEAVLDLVDFDKLPDDEHGHIHKGIGHVVSTGELEIPTLEGMMTARPGDWIIRGVKGELYPCKPDIFEATYEPDEEEMHLIQLDERGWTVQHTATCRT